jgi:hypothetical protein
VTEGSEPGRTRPAGSAVGAVLVGCAFAFVSWVNLVRALRPELLLDAEPSWAIARLFLGLVVISGTLMAGVLAASLFSLLSRFAPATAPLEPFHLAPAALAILAIAALLFGGIVRLIDIDSVPEFLWIDEVTVIEPALALTGHWRDFSDTLRGLRFGETPGTTGVLYLEYLRLVLTAFGVSTHSLRLHVALAGIVCLATTALLARQLLPRGGATLAAIVIAGLYWSVAMARIGWEAMVMVPIVDIATVLLLFARRRWSPALAISAGAVMGLAPHFYLSSWAAAVALLAIASWPPSPEKSAPPLRRRILVPVLFALGFCLLVSPIFVFRERRSVPYFLRTQQTNVVTEIRYWRSPMPLFEAAADGIRAPWFTPRHIWPPSAGLGFTFRVLLAVAFLRAILRPRDELSIVVLAQGGAALAATILGGHRGVPNWFRFAYLSDVAAVAIAGGGLWLLLLAQRPERRVLGIAVTGLLAAGSLLSARDLLRDFTGPPGGDASGKATVVGRAALRWERYGKVGIDPTLLRYPGMAAAIRRYRLDPEDRGAAPESAAAPLTGREFRIVPPGGALREGERAVELVRNRGRMLAVVVGKRRP